MGTDTAALYITTFAMESFVKRVLRKQPNTSQATIMHFQKGLQLLRERLVRDDNEMKISDSTIAMVAKLASAAHFNGNYQVSKQHMQGLRRMVDLRGGVEVLNGKRLLVGMLR